MRSRLPGGRRMLAVLAVLAVLAAACGADGRADGSSAVTGAATSTTTAPGAAPAADGSTASTGAGAVPPGTGGGDPAGPASTGVPTSHQADGSVIAVGALPVGGVAPALLRPGRGDRVVLEVRAQEGAAPAPATIDHVARVLGSSSGKPVGVVGPAVIGGGGRDWTRQEIVSAAAAAASVESGRSQVVLRLLFLRGTFEGDTGVLGVAVAGDVAAVFSDRVDDAAGVLVSPGVVEDAVTMHEVGHLLALVDLLLGTGRGDPEHPGHSRNRRSVMYWQVESGLITQLLDGGIPRDLDADDLAELAQIRAGAG